MDNLRDYSDSRLRGSCVYCGGPTETRDHVPSKVLLDPPYPANLPVVFACEKCNNSFSEDEEYLACLLECAATGSTSPAEMSRGKVRTILENKLALSKRLELARSRDESGQVIFNVEVQRFRRVLLKLARGHVVYEEGEPKLTAPSRIAFVPLATLTRADREAFETAPAIGGWPEVGSRAFQRTIVAFPYYMGPDWIDVQEGRYRYLVAASSETVVRMVLGEYLACEAVWERE